MSFPVAAGSVSYSGTYIPTMWAPKLLVKFYERTVLSEIANTDYEGKIKDQGDKVTINQRPTITINDHVKDQDLDYENPEVTSLTLNIDHGKSYSFNVPKIDVKQSIIEFVNEWTDDAGRELKIDIERDIYADIYSDAAAANAGASAGAISGDINLGVTGTPKVLTDANILDYIVDMGVILDEQNVPKEDRWLLLPAWAIGRLKTSDIKDASLTGDDKSTLRTGKTGMVDNFMVYSTNLLYVSGTEHNILAGHKSALTFAMQLTENESLKNPKAFGMLHRGLCVYGYKVVKDEALVHGVVAKS